MATIKEKSIAMREALVDDIIELMESVGLSWTRGWNQEMFLPRNGVTETFYRGVNRMSLAMRAYHNGWEDPRWATAHQAIQNGWKIKKGSKASIVEKWGTRSFTIEKEVDGEIEQKTKSVITLQKIYYVFNFEQLEGPEPYKPLTRERVGFELADQLIESSKCPVLETGSERACYQLLRDQITLPHRNAFDSPQRFVEVLTHEMAHSTGHKSRLNREDKMKNHFGTPAYAEEELRAEFSSVFFNAYLHVEYGSEHLENHAAYLQSWLTAVREDKKVMLEAITEAEKIADYLIQNYQDSLSVVSHCA